MKAIASWTVTLLLAFVGLTACGGDDDETTTAEGADASALVGSYTRQVTEADLDRTQEFRSEGPGQQKPPPGTYELTLTAADLTAAGPDGLSIIEAYTVEGDSTLTTRSYLKFAFCGEEIPVEATYTWSVEEGTLELTAEDDACADRDSILTGTWTER
jgi:hypothetical protein